MFGNVWEKPLIVSTEAQNHNLCSVLAMLAQTRIPWNGPQRANGQ
jgi:hypothetical protein